MLSPPGHYAGFHARPRRLRSGHSAHDDGPRRASFTYYMTTPHYFAASFSAFAATALVDHASRELLFDPASSDAGAQAPAI